MSLIDAEVRPQIAIIGAGPAGITAAIQLKRYGFSPLLIEKSRAGGLLRNANWVENYPGFPDGISGPNLTALFERQLQNLGVSIIREEVVQLDVDNEGAFQINTNRNSYRASHVIVSSGTKPKPYPIAIPETARDRVFSEVWPLQDSMKKHIVIAGSGDAAFDYALNLAKQNSVTILNRSKKTSCLRLLRERAARTPGIAYRDGSSVTGVALDATRMKLKIACLHNGTQDEIPADNLIFAIGRESQLDFLSGRIHTEKDKLARDRHLFFAGDVSNGLFRQVAIAAGDGLRAAMAIYADLLEGR
jgi:thioredoxin reductase (NADPH)